MTYILISLLAIESALILSWGFKTRERYLQLPILVAAVFLGWVLPQFLGLTNWYGQPAGALDKTILMAILCLAASYWGYVQNKRPAKLFEWRFNRKRLLHGSAALSLLGAYFYFKVGQLSAEVTGLWTGPITVYAFFAQMLSVGFAIALILHLKRASLGTWLILGFDLLFILDRVVIQGRRADAAEVFLMLLLAIWFTRRWAPSRSVMISAFIVGALVINSAGDYRGIMVKEDRTSWSGAGVEQLSSIDFVGNLKKIAEGNAGGEEVRNAAMTIEAVDRRWDFDFGLSLWNAFIFYYVPAQFVGTDLKKALRADLGAPAAYLEFGYVPWTGSTVTGLADSFASFWFFGAVKFFLIGYIMSRWYQAANGGQFVAQLVIMLSMTQALHAVTHDTANFFLVFVRLAAFIIPVVVYARVRRRRGPLLPRNNEINTVGSPSQT